MLDAEIQSLVIPHLRDRVARGDAILFLGAGFSLETKNVLGVPPPAGEVLRKRLWEMCFPNDEFSPNSTLPDLFHTAQGRAGGKLKDFLLQNYSIDAGSIPAWYLDYFSTPWRKIYTLNVDDLEVAAARAFKLSRPVRTYSALRRGGAEGGGDPDTPPLDVVHLNGCAVDGPQGVTFSQVQYADRLTQPDSYYRLVAAELVDRVFVFVGTQLEEPSFWQQIQQRGGKGRGAADLRAKCYLVSPSLEKARVALLKDLNVTWLDMTAEQFAERILDAISGVRTAGLQAIADERRGRRGVDDLQDVATVARTAKDRPGEYLLGREPTWVDLVNGRSATRECDASAWEQVQAALKLDCPGAVAITGTAGSGKSTLLMRSALRLASEGRTVAWIDRFVDVSPRRIREVMKSDKAPAVVAIDDASSYGPELSTMIREICLLKRKPLFLLAMRATKVDQVLNPAILGEVRCLYVPMPGLSDADIGALLDLLTREGRLGVLKNRARRDQERVFRERAERQLLVAMIEATSGRRFEDRLLEELNELDTLPRDCYAIVAVASALGYDMPRDEILVAVGRSDNDALTAVHDLVDKGILIEARGLRTRHRVIADVLLNYLQAQRLLHRILEGLASVVATKLNGAPSGRSPERRFLTRILSHDFLLRMLGSDDARSLYQSLQDILLDDHHYWLQRGSLELETGETNLAENFLNQARNLAGEDDLKIETAWAYLLFKQAIEKPGAADSAKRVEQAMGTLEGMIANRGRLDRYPYHVLGSQGLSWSRRGIASPGERGRFLARLLKAMTDGRARHPAAAELLQLETDIKRDYLSVAVSP